MKCLARFACIALAAMAGVCLAGPARPISSALFVNPMPAGPAQDPMAVKGQWFYDPTSGLVHAKDWEFHDDDIPMTINGIVQSITFDGSPASNIVAFTVLATVINNLPSEYQPGVSSNSHYEVQGPMGVNFAGSMRQTRISAEFAIADISLLPSGTPPYYLDPVSGGKYWIEAVNEQELAWYCWTPGDPQYNPQGAYQVPTWVLGDIATNGVASVLMAFQITGGAMPMSDYRHSVIRASKDFGMDIFYNRHTSLKISHWLDTLLVDYGGYITAPPGQYEEPPPEYIYASDVSVFFEQELDFGDAPDRPYPTLLANNGARHVVNPAVFMGALIDSEPDGQPDPVAMGDDIANLADEDGVAFTSALIPGSGASITVICSTPGFLSAWIDFNQNGSWSDPGEMIFAVQSMSAGLNALAFFVPGSAGIGPTFARFRFTTLQTPIGFDGLVADGEVEDYIVYIEPEPEFDYGDAKDGVTAPGYPTLLTNNGAGHQIVPGVFLGKMIDAELDGQPDPSAKGDDIANLADEDGVFLPPAFIAGAGVNVQVLASTNGFLNAWIDWNANGSWADSGENVFVNVPLSPGLNSLLVTVPVPPAFVSGGPHSRWRFTTYAPRTPAFTGIESDGEVEDYEAFLQVLDFGDAPDLPYPTRLANNGARHLIPSSYYLGATPPDLEPDGQPIPPGLGDDTTGNADEDGIVSADTLVWGSNATLRIVASTKGYLNAWIDFNCNGSWADAIDPIAVDYPLLAGTNALVVSVPAGSGVGQTLGRFRFSSYKGLAPTGLAMDGEVEDHVFTLYQPQPGVAFAITNIACCASNDTVVIRWDGQSPTVFDPQFAEALTTNTAWTSCGGYVIVPPYEHGETMVTQRFYRVRAPFTFP